MLYQQDCRYEAADMRFTCDQGNDSLVQLGLCGNEDDGPKPLANITEDQKGKSIQHTMLASLKSSWKRKSRAQHAPEWFEDD